MSKSKVKNKNLSEGFQDLLKMKPENYDIKFCVGPEKKLVRGLKVILEAACPVLVKEFEERWNLTMTEEEEGILLPYFDGNAFELFIKLITLDTWNETTLKNLCLPLNTLLDLIKICSWFEMTEELKHLTEITASFFRSFQEFQKCEDFLLLSQENLETVLASNKILIGEFDLFQAACRWAVARCKKSGIEASTENLRLVLGDCLYEIRFPLMTGSEFSKARKLYDILTPKESLDIYEFIGLGENEKKCFDKFSIMFKTKPRNIIHYGCTILSLLGDFDVVEDPLIQCDGMEIELCFIPNKKIAIHGLGFLGPVHEDGRYVVNFQMKDSVKRNYWNGDMMITWAEKGDVICWMFDYPIILEGRDLNWGNHYTIVFSLEGPPTYSVQRKYGFRSDHLRLQEGDTEFLIECKYSQLIEIHFKNV